MDGKILLIFNNLPLHLEGFCTKFFCWNTMTDRTSTLFVKKFCLICVVMQLFNKNWNCESNMKHSKVAFESQKEDIVMHVIFHAPAPAARRKDYALIKNLWCLPSSLWVLSRPETVLFSDGLNRDPLHRVYYFFAIMSIRKAYSEETWNGLIFGWT